MVFYESNISKGGRDIMHTGIPYMISNCVITLFWYIAANLILDSRYSKWKTVLIEAGIQIVFWMITENVFPFFSAIRHITGFLLPLGMILYFHTDRTVLKVFTTVSILISVAVAEMMLSAFLPHDAIFSGEVFEKYAVPVYSLYVFLVFIAMSFVVVLLRAFKQKYRGLLMEKMWFLFLLFPASQVLTMYVWLPSFVNMDPGNYVKEIAVIVLDILADISLAYMMYQTARSTELRIRSEMLEEQISSQGNYYTQLASTYTDIRKMRHDIDNHILAIQSLLDTGEVDSASRYVHDLSVKKVPEVRLSDCRNTVIASYLEKKFEDITKRGITLETSIHLPFGVDISDPDLICIYGNILDNAMEACKDIPAAEIHLHTLYKAPYLMITCKNSAREQTEKKQRRIAELDRGVGFTILSGIAEKYDGQFNYHMEDNMFYTEVALKAGE